MAESVLAVVEVVEATPTTIASPGVTDVLTRHVVGTSLTAATPAPLRRRTTDQTFIPLIITSETGRGTPYSGTFVAFSTSPRNTSSGVIYDTSYTSCQPLGAQNTYSPGICPNGQTVAEVTEYHYSTTSGSIATRFKASCCQSGMEFRAELQSACISNISTPLPIYAPFTTTIDGEGITAYEYVGQALVSETWSTKTFSNISTVTSGFIGTDPIVVSFQEQDLRSFPSEYVSSLAKRYNRTWTAATTTSFQSIAPTAASSPTLPAQTSPPSHDPIPSTRAKAGIGISVSIGVITFSVIGLLLFFRRKQRSRLAEQQASDDDVPEMEDRDEVHSSKKWYLFGKWRNEMPAENQKQEMDSSGVHEVNRIPVELDSSEQPQELSAKDVSGEEAACEMMPRTADATRSVKSI